MPDSSRYHVDLVLFWIDIYRKRFGIELKNIFIPAPETSFEGKWLIVRDPSLSAERLIEQFRKEYDIFVWTERSLDTVLNQEDSARNAYAGPYGVWVEAGEDPDADLRHKSGANLKHIGVTLEERLLLEYFYWQRSGKHLDLLYRTLCSGSTYDNGGIPVVGWDLSHNRLIVDCCFLPERAFAELCVRKVIAAPEVYSLGAYH